MKAILIVLTSFLMFSCEGRQVDDYFYNSDAKKHKPDAAIETDVLEQIQHDDATRLPDKQESDAQHPEPDSNIAPEYAEETQLQPDAADAVFLDEQTALEPDEYCMDAAPDTSVEITAPDIAKTSDSTAETAPDTAQTPDSITETLFDANQISETNTADEISTPDEIPAPDETITPDEISTPDEIITLDETPTPDNSVTDIPNLCECIIYKNAAKGFGFAYPENWAIAYDDGSRVDLDSKPEAGSDETDRIYVSIEVMQNETGGPDDEWITDIMERFIDTVALDNKTIKLDILGTGEHLGLYTVVTLKTAVISINLRYLYPDFEKVADAKVKFAKIVASFTNI